MSGFRAMVLVALGAVLAGCAGLESESNDSCVPKRTSDDGTDGVKIVKVVECEILGDKEARTDAKERMRGLVVKEAARMAGIRWEEVQRIVNDVLVEDKKKFETVNGVLTIKKLYGPRKVGDGNHRVYIMAEFKPEQSSPGLSVPVVRPEPEPASPSGTLTVETICFQWYPHLYAELLSMMKQAAGPDVKFIEAKSCEGSCFRFKGELTQVLGRLHQQGLEFKTPRAEKNRIYLRNPTVLDWEMQCEDN